MHWSELAFVRVQCVVIPTGKLRILHGSFYVTITGFTSIGSLHLPLVITKCQGSVRTLGEDQRSYVLRVNDTRDPMPLESQKRWIPLTPLSVGSS